MFNDFRNCISEVDPPTPQDKKDLKTQLEMLARSSQWLVLWLDCDREGENISFEVCISRHHWASAL